MDSMYAYIKGELAEKNIDSIVVEAAGVGYLIYIPTQYFDINLLITAGPCTQDAS